jgi:acyl-coenzyme A thioesterase PaaI-like protein
MARRISAGIFRLFMNFWPPYRGAGIRVRRIAADWSEVRVELVARRFNRNYFGTHFGGSLFAMADPFHALMLAHVLGDDYLVWDQASAIEYVKPGRGTVASEIRLAATDVDAIRSEAAGGAKVLREFGVEIRDGEGDLVACVRKQLYIRLKKRLRAGPAS